MDYYQKRKKKKLLRPILSTISTIRDNEYSTIENAFDRFELEGAKYVTNIGQNTFK